MSKIDLFVEVGKKRTWAGALDWPGFCRSGKDEPSAVASLFAYRHRYAGILNGSDVTCRLPDELSSFRPVERVAGNATTDFGAPNLPLAADGGPVSEVELSRLQEILRACWAAFDRSAAAASGAELRRGPRGGGRGLDQIIQHVVDAEASYIRKLPFPFSADKSAPPAQEAARLRLAIIEGLSASARGQLPSHGPRGGTIWAPRTFVRRAAWHLLDHLWEIEDRL